MPNAAVLLCSDEGRRLLSEVAAHTDEVAANPLAFGEKLRSRGVDPGLASAVAAQVALRSHAQGKFGDVAQQMLFTREGLEQSSRLDVARAHAQRFIAAGATHVADLGCGIGADARAFAEGGLRVFAVELDADTALLASENLRAFAQARALHADVTTLDISALKARGVDAIFADPARRTGARRGNARILSPEDWSPPLSLVLSWRELIPALGIKVAPGIAHEVLPADSRVEWTSHNGSLVEAAIWTGPLAMDHPGRAAVLIREGTTYELSEEESYSPQAPVRQAELGHLQQFIGEPDDAVIRSGLVALLAERVGGHLISQRIAYLSTSTPQDNPFITWFDVIDEVPLKTPAIRAALRAADIGRIEVKKRGADVDPAALRKAVKAQGSGDGAVFATRVAGRHRAIIARRVASAPST